MTFYQPNYDPLASLPSNTESVRSFELLRKGFPAGDLSPTRIYVQLNNENPITNENTPITFLTGKAILKNLTGFAYL